MRDVTFDGEHYFLVFGNLHRHAESSTCGIDFNGQAEWHMRHTPHVNRSQFLAVTDHGEHLNNAGSPLERPMADLFNVHK